jgi:hypothetical protein
MSASRMSRLIMVSSLMMLVAAPAYAQPAGCRKMERVPKVSTKWGIQWYCPEGTFDVGATYCLKPCPPGWKYRVANVGGYRADYCCPGPSLRRSSPGPVQVIPRN